MKDYYQILGVVKNASEEEIKRAYRKKALAMHPDKSGGFEPHMKELNEAYNILKNGKTKTEYDLKGLFSEENQIFYSDIDAYSTRSFYDDWKEDSYYKRMIIYLWVILGFVLALIIVFVFALNPVEFSKSSGNKYEAPQLKELSPKELDNNDVEDLHELIKEI